MGKASVYPRAEWTRQEREEWHQFQRDGWSPRGAGLLLDMHHAIRRAQAEAATAQAIVTPEDGERVADG